MNEGVSVTIDTGGNEERSRVLVMWEPPDVTSTRTEEIGRFWIKTEGDRTPGTSVAFFARVVKSPVDCETADAAEHVVEYIRQFIKVWGTPEHADGLSHPPSVVIAAPELLAACKAALADRFGGDDECCDVDPLTVMIRTAIRKAEGGGA